MFETKINLFLQSFSTPFLDQFMISVSWLGDETFVVGLLCVIALGVDFKRGFILLQLFLLTLISTDILKTLFALPKPFYLNANLNDFGALFQGLQPLQDAAARTFFGPLPESSIIAYRELGLGTDEFGLPSGHTSSAVALWGGLALVFRKRLLVYLAVVLVVLMMISRMYLARHFLADALGGAALGLFMLFVAGYLLRRYNYESLFQRQTYKISGENLGPIWLYAIGFAFPIVVILMGEGFIGRLSALTAINLAFLLILFWGVQAEGGAIWQRILRVVIGFGLFYAVNAGVKMLPLDQTGDLYQIVKGFLPPFVLFLGACVIVSLLMGKQSTKSGASPGS
ncbi:MAG: phosphatase PAP2 family protein [Proteobacteria bacterium]|nr:phosphatase PAP2 family protein [Pseudomonadota bacterium]